MTNSVNVASLGAAMVADNGGRVGIKGTPQNSYAGWTNLFLNGNNQLSADGTSIQIQANNYLDASATNWIRSSAAPVSRVVFAESIAFNQAATGAAGSTISWTQTMTVNSNNTVQIGTTSAGGWSGNQKFAVESAIAGGWGISSFITTGQGCYLSRVDTTAINHMVFFYGSGASVGSIAPNGTNAVSYITTSDYRLKENITPMTGALAKVAQLKPVTYKWKSDGSDGQGFIAHELAEVVPDCVSGEKDAVETYTDEDGNEQTRIKAQGIDTSFLVATLTAAMQEQQKIIQELKARIVALEAK
jgi:hypothetical protein